VLRVGVAAPPGSGYPDRLRDAGCEPVLIPLPETASRGIGLRREWTADATEMAAAVREPDGLLLAAPEPEVLAGLVIAALRLNLPAVVAGRARDATSAAVAAMGLAPQEGDAAELAAALAGEGGPKPQEIVQSFSLANALRASCALSGGPEPLVHLAAIAREANVPGFGSVMRVISRETGPATTPGSEWFLKHGVPGILKHLGRAVHDTRTVAGRLRDRLPDDVPEPPDAEGSGLVFMRDRRKTVEAVGWSADTDKTYASGKCLVFAGEEAAVRAVESGGVEPRRVLVVAGCGPRSGSGLLRLTRFSEVLEESGLAGRVAVFTDGVAPAAARGVWVSLATPEAAAAGLPSRLMDGDMLYLGLDDGAIRVGVSSEDLEGTELLIEAPNPPPGYQGRYTRDARPALEGAGFP
jgi:dihydroxy-acid dehydratase